MDTLTERGFTFEGRLLALSDGAKGRIAGIRAAFRDRVGHQRCQWRKRENAVRRIPNKDTAQDVRSVLQAAYETDTYAGKEERRS